MCTTTDKKAKVPLRVMSWLRLKLPGCYFSWRYAKVRFPTDWWFSQPQPELTHLPNTQQSHSATLNLSSTYLKPKQLFL